MIVNKVKGEYAARNERIASYLNKVKDELNMFASYNINQIPRVENSNTNALEKLVTSKDSELLKIIPVEVIGSSIIEDNNEP